MLKANFRIFHTKRNIEKKHVIKIKIKTAVGSKTSIIRFPTWSAAQNVSFSSGTSQLLNPDTSESYGSYGNDNQSNAGTTVVLIHLNGVAALKIGQNVECPSVLVVYKNASFEVKLAQFKTLLKKSIKSVSGR